MTVSTRNTFLAGAGALALITIGGVAYAGGGMSGGEELQVAMTWGLLMFAVSIAFLIAATRYLARDEETRVARATALGEPPAEQASVA